VENRHRVRANAVMNGFVHRPNLIDVAIVEIASSKKNVL
jgi:hypothetical protein